MSNFFMTQLVEAVKKKKSHVCVGLDPDFARIPPTIKEQALAELGYTKRAIARSILRFNREIIEAVKDIAVVVKLQSAYFEEYGHWGFEVLEETISFCHKCGLLTILDVKRGDIDTTARAYARAFLGRINFWRGESKEGFNADAVTINPFLGRDSLEPFFDALEAKGKGAFVLVKTSNPGSGDLQDLKLATGEPLYERLGHLVDLWGKDYVPAGSSYSSVGAVVGATFPEIGRRLRRLMPQTYFLVPGYGAQGAKGEDLLVFFNEDGLGALVNASRSIIFAWEKAQKAEAVGMAARKAALAMKEEINGILAKANMLAWK